MKILYNVFLLMFLEIPFLAQSQNPCTIQVRDAQTLDRPAQTQISVFSQQPNQATQRFIGNYQTNEAGDAEIWLQPNQNYRLQVKNPNYFNQYTQLNTSKLIPKNFAVSLRPRFALRVSGILKDKNTGQIIPNGLLYIIQGADTLEVPIQNGKYSFYSQPDRHYQTLAVVTGYEPTSDAIHIPPMEKESNADANAQLQTSLTLNTNLSIALDLALALKKKPTPVPVYKTPDTIALPKLQFDIKNSNILDNDSLELERLCAALRENPNLEVALHVHTNTRQKSHRLCMILSKQRAENIRLFLDRRSIQAQRVQLVPEGCENPLQDCFVKKCNDAENHKNDRVEVVVLKK